MNTLNDDLKLTTSLVKFNKKYVAWMATTGRATFALIRPFSYSRKKPGSSVIFIYFMQDVRSSAVRPSIAIVRIRKFFKLHQNIVRFRFLLRVAERSISHDFIPNNIACAK